MDFERGSLGYIFQKAAYMVATSVYQVGSFARARYAASPTMPAVKNEYSEGDEEKIFRAVQKPVAVASAAAGFLGDLGVLGAQFEGKVSGINFAILEHLPVVGEVIPGVQSALEPFPVAKGLFAAAASGVTGLYLAPNFHGLCLCGRYGVPMLAQRIGKVQVYTPK